MKEQVPGGITQEGWTDISEGHGGIEDGGTQV
jgi:hypothetical protein